MNAICCECEAFCFMTIMSVVFHCFSWKCFKSRIIFYKI